MAVSAHSLVELEGPLVLNLLSHAAAIVRRRLKAHFNS